MYHYLACSVREQYISLPVGVKQRNYLFLIAGTESAWTYHLTLSQALHSPLVFTIALLSDLYIYLSDDNIFSVIIDTHNLKTFLALPLGCLCTN